MISRRDVMKGGAIGSVLLAVPQMVSAAETPALDALLLDTRVVPTVPPGHEGVPLLRFAGDVTRVWYDHLDRRWRQPGHVLGGITGSDALFVLEVLAAQAGRRVVHRQTLAPADGNDVATISWVIAPHHPSVMV